jgi:hypothetical protein
MSSTARKQLIPEYPTDDQAESKEIKLILTEEQQKPADPFRQGIKASLFSDLVKSVIRSGVHKPKPK